MKRTILSFNGFIMTTITVIACLLAKYFMADVDACAQTAVILAFIDDCNILDKPEYLTARVYKYQRKHQIPFCEL
jgi:hypothetical protein